MASESSASQLRKGVLELAVLALLADEARYGSQLVEDLAASPALAISAGTVYPLLARLLKSGLASSRWQESTSGPPRKYYSLTPKGHETLASLSANWRDIATAVDDLLAGGKQ